MDVEVNHLLNLWVVFFILCEYTEFCGVQMAVTTNNTSLPASQRYRNGY